MSYKAEIALGFASPVDGDRFVLKLCTDGINSVSHTLTATTGSTTATHFHIGVDDLDTLNEFYSLLNLIPNFYSHYNVHDSGAEISLEPMFWGNQYNFGTVLDNTPRLYVVSGSQKDNTIDPFVADYETTDNLCFGASTGTITLDISGGADGHYDFLWNDLSTIQNRTGLPAGTYSVDITDEVGTTITLSGIVISEPASPVVVTNSKTNVLCFGAANGTINLSVSGGDGPYTFLWGDGPTTQNRTGLAPGTYSCAITDANGCITNVSGIVITQPSSAISVIATVDGNNINLAVSGGTSPYTYLWNDAATTQNRTGLSPGTYTCTITDANGCTEDVEVILSIYRFFLSRNPIILELTASSPGTKPNLSFICEVWLEPVYLSGTYTKIITLEQPADSNAHTVFNVQSVLDAYVEPHLPSVNQDTVSRADNIFKRFYLKYTEKFGTPPEPDNFTQVDVNYVILGGLSYEEYAANTFFTTFLDAQKPFFTWDPVSKSVFQEQPEYLYFMVNSFSVAEFKAKVKIYYTDGTDSTHTFHTETGTFRYEVYIIPAGYDQLDLSSYNTDKTVKSWDIFITDDLDNLISEVRKYALITEYFPVKRFILFLNSLGGFNTLAATGKGKYTIDTDVVDADKLLPHDYLITDGEFTILDKVGNPSLKISSGYKSKEYNERLQDFLISRSVYLLENGRHIPVKVNTRSSEIYDEEDTLYALEFTIEGPKIHNYTPKI